MIKSLVARKEGGLSKEKTSSTIVAVASAGLVAASTMGLISAGDAQTTAAAVEQGVTGVFASAEALFGGLLTLYLSISNLWARNRAEKT